MNVMQIEESVHFDSPRQGSIQVAWFDGKLEIRKYQNDYDFDGTLIFECDL